MDLDWNILHWIHDTTARPFPDFLMPKITALGNGGAVWLAAAGGLACTKKYRKQGVLLLGGLTAGVLVGNVFLKNVIARPRPCWLDQSVPLLVKVPKDYSFPSGHTLSSVIGAVILTRTDRRFGWAAIPLASLISFSRLYLYVHFPSDILGAAVPGVAIGELTFRWGGRALEKRAAQTKDACLPPAHWPTFDPEQNRAGRKRRKNRRANSGKMTDRSRFNSDLPSNSRKTESLTAHHGGASDT